MAGSLLALGIVVLTLAAGAEATSGPVVSWAGVVNQGGCPDCCNFSCRQTPTPTPEFDSFGRRVFTRSLGRFLFIAEGAIGESLLPPSVTGTRDSRGRLEGLGDFDRPGMQVLFSRALGNGDPFIECETNVSGGVPAGDGLDEAATTDAMVDAACRFEWVSSGTPCTRNRFGGFSTMSPSTSRQFCFQVPTAAEFPPGETVVSVQMMDRAGNVGPVEQVVVRVGTPVATPTPTPTAVGPHDVSGSVLHFATGAPVAGVEVSTMSGSDDTTGADGSYSFIDLVAMNESIVPRKEGGVGSAVSALDAAYVLQFAAATRSFTSLQELACDVTGDGTVSALDASQILKQQVGLIGDFAVTGASLCDSDWGFFPFPDVQPNQTTTVPAISGSSCVPGSINFAPLSANATGQSFIAYAFGDCTGNWQSGAGAATQAVDGGGLRIGRVRRARSGRIKVPVYLDSAADDFQSVAFDVHYDAQALVPVAVRRAGVAQSALVAASADASGRLRVALASPIRIASDGRPVAILRFSALRGGRRGAPEIRLTNAILDERSIH